MLEDLPGDVVVDTGPLQLPDITRQGGLICLTGVVEAGLVIGVPFLKSGVCGPDVVLRWPAPISCHRGPVDNTACLALTL